FHVGEAEALILAEADDENSLAMLGRPVAAVDDTEVDRIAEFFGQDVLDGLEGLALVMADEVADVLEQEGRRAMVGDDARDIIEQRALGLVLEPVRPPQRIFLR